MAFVARKFAETGRVLNSERYYVPVAPGAVSSPQEPGQVPDRSDIPGHTELPVPAPAEDVRRPLTEYGTSQEIMDVYDNPELAPDDPKRFMQAPPGYEELRKATPWLGKPLRPQPGYALSAGIRLSSPARSELAAEVNKALPIDPGQ